MLIKLPQIQKPWFASMVSAIYNKIQISFLAAKEVACKPSAADLSLHSDLFFISGKITSHCISKKHQERLDNLCSKVMKTTSSFLSQQNDADNCCTASTLNQSNNCSGKSNQSENGLHEHSICMEVDDSHEEVIEISDVSFDSSQGNSKEIAPGFVIDEVEFPTCNVLKTQQCAFLPQCEKIFDGYSTFEAKCQDDKFKERSRVNSSPPGLEIRSMEVDSFDRGFLLNDYIDFKRLLASSEDISKKEIQFFFQSLQEQSSADILKIFTFLETSLVSENTIVNLIYEFLSTENFTFQTTVIFAEYVLGSYIIAMQKVASRNLVVAVTWFSQKCPKAFVDGTMAKHFDRKCLLWSQCDLMVKISKTMHQESLRYFMMQLVQSKKDEYETVWNEHMITLLSTVIDRQIDFDAEHFQKLVNWLQFQSMPLASCLKFTKLLLILIKKYGSLVKKSLPLFKQMLMENTTFLKKSAVSILKKLEN